MSKVIVITGPTGVGKTDLSIKLAKKLNAEIINADSMQIFKEMNIGTNKITEIERDGIIHHLIDIKELDDEYSVYDYQREGRLLIEDIIGRGKTVILVGGSGLYLSALLYDYEFNEESKEEITISKEEMLKVLEENDISIDKDNFRRIERAYQRYVHNAPLSKKGDNLLYDVNFIGLTMERASLYERINTRVHKMIEKGLIEEVKALYKEYPHSKPLNTAIGYKEIISYLNEEISLDEAIKLIQKNTRNYAKRQYTWFNNKMNITWYDVNDLDLKQLINDIK